MKETNTTNPGHWDWRLFFSILLFFCIPSVYKSYSLYLIGNTQPGENNLAIVAQWQFVQVALEVLQEALVLPIFFFVGSQWRQGREEVFKKTKASLFFMFAVLTPVLMLLTLGMSFFAEQAGTEESLKAATINFLRLKSGALFLGIFNTGLTIVVESLRKKGFLLKLLGLKLILSLIFDSWFFGRYGFSLSLGVMGVALSNLITELIILLAAGCYFHRLFQMPLKRYLSLPSLADYHLFRKVSQWVALESFIRNAAYFVMILQLINALGPKQIGGYYLGMHLFWSFALLPVNALAETMKALIANSAMASGAIRKVLQTGLGLGAALLLLWLLPLPFLGSILSIFSDDPEMIAFARQSVAFLLAPYMLLAMNQLLDTLFIGLGKTQYLAYQSILTNLGVYGIAFLLYQGGYWAPTFTNILVLFGVGILMDSMLTVWFGRIVLREVPGELDE